MKKELTPEQRSHIRYLLETVQAEIRTPGLVISPNDPVWDRLERRRLRQNDEATYSYLNQRLEEVITPRSPRKR